MRITNVQNIDFKAYSIYARENYDLLEENVHEGVFGINIHRATRHKGKKSYQVDKWSAGCQVIASNDDWHEFLGICKKAADIWGNSFTYTLIESEDIV